MTHYPLTVFFDGACPIALERSLDHAGATKHFKTAYDLGKDNAEIQNSDILKKHLKM